MEGAVPILLSRRAAGPIVAVDISYRERIAAVKHYTGARFDYHSGLTHGNTVSFLRSQGVVNFDVVVLSGVLYHCFGPLHTLAMARSLILYRRSHDRRDFRRRRRAIRHCTSMRGASSSPTRVPISCHRSPFWMDPSRDFKLTPPLPFTDSPLRRGPTA